MNLFTSLILARIFWHFSGERGEHEVRDTRDGRGAKKIMPVHQPLFMLFRPQTHPQITNQLQRLIKVVKRVVMFREPRTERPPAKMKEVDQNDENANTEELPNHFI